MGRDMSDEQPLFTLLWPLTHGRHASDGRPGVSGWSVRNASSDSHTVNTA